MSLNNFADRIGAEVTRIDPSGRKQSFVIDSFNMAKYLFELQQYGYKYTFINVHNSENTCVACEG